MKQGFYEELDTLRGEQQEADFGFMGNVIGSYGYTAFDFLHGYCCTFAYYLSRKYGYPIKVRKPKGDNYVIHAWCQSDGNFIDIRGITNRFYEFWEEYEDFDSFDEEDEAMETLVFADPTKFKDFIGIEYDDFSPRALKAAMFIHNEHKEYYQLSKFKAC